MSRVGRLLAFKNNIVFRTIIIDLIPIVTSIFLLSTLLSTMSSLSSNGMVPKTIHSFPGISISTINCNSLNVSTVTSYHQRLKIYGIVQLKTDFIILSDIRLGKSKNTISEINKMFLTNPYCSYNFVHNSTGNSRGVGILIKSNLSVLVLAEARDSLENILALRIQLSGTEFVLCGIYGPNNVCPQFFSDLNNIFSNAAALPIIVGGDWNCTPSSDPVKVNIDVINMANLPNIQHSKTLDIIMTKFKLVDLYRCYFPKRKDFTFIPKCKVKKNRSRIDFILVSDPLLGLSKVCDIAPSVPNSLFDHKSVFVNFNKSKVPTQRTAIAARMLKDPLVDLLVMASAIECYLHHSKLRENLKTLKLNEIGQIRNLIKLAGPDPILNHIIGWDERKDLIRANNIADIAARLDEFDLDELEALDLDIESDIFLEYFVNCIRNDVANYQIFCSKTVNDAKNKLISDIKNLKDNASETPIETQLLITEKESSLNAIVDSEMKYEFERSKHFDILNSEKITPSFLKILRGSNVTAKLSDICDSDGNAFANDLDRTNYIVNFFRGIYTKPATEPENLTGCIEKFLGPEIVSSSLVKNSILTAAERTKLESSFAINELDDAIKKANMNSAAGIDGLSTRFISKFWKYFRVPLFKYATCCFRKGTLTSTFKSATIRLIPKKGENTSIKNWRPISLLSNLYKVLSRAINNRLLTTTDRILSRAQKGFTKSRYLQEVLINVIEFIGHCNSSNVSAFVLSIDYAKAFDTLSVNFMRECYKFFGFGDYFINMLETVGKNRTASIILDDGSYSSLIDLETGRPQGENLSPGQYNIANQIMLFRLELDPKIKSVYQHFLLPKWNFDPPGINKIENSKFLCESYRQTGNAEGFADDTTSVGELSSDNINLIKQILDEFSIFSGLKCNYDKTILVPVGENAEPYNFDPGKFTVAGEFTLLGMKIDNKLEKLLDNFQLVIEKMLKITRFWSRLNLTLPGRIAVAKTFLISQINHIGCILTPTNLQIDMMQNIIDNYCLSSLKLAKDKLYLPPKKGGLGIINLREFIIAQHVMWFKRAAQSTRDNWRIDLCRLGYGNPLTVPATNISVAQHPILSGLCKSYNVFRKAFNEIGENYKSAYIFNNPLIKRGINDDSQLNASFFGGKDNPDLRKISYIRYSDCWDHNEFVSRDYLSQ